MVRGVSRRVIVVRPEKQGVFEQAIFLVRDCDAPRSDILREACRIANSYLVPRRRSRRGADRLSLLAGFCAGALFVGMLWALAALFL